MQMNAVENYALPEGKSLGLKVVHKDGRPEYHKVPEGFRWNLELGGETEAPDWNPDPKVGGGLHVWAWAQGDIRASHIWYRTDVLWMAVEYETDKAVDLWGKVKARRCKTIAISPNRKEIISFIQEHTPEEKRDSVLDEKVIEVAEGDVEVGEGGIAIVRGKGSARAGYGGYAEASDGGTAIAGDDGAARVGEGGTATTGNDGIAVAGDGGTAIVGEWGHACSGRGGTAVAGDWGEARAGTGGTVKAGKGGYAEAGDGGTAVAGYGGTVVAGEGSKASVGFGGLVRLKRGQGWVVGWALHSLKPKSNLKPDTFYKLDDSGDFVEIVDSE